MPAMSMSVPQRNSSVTSDWPARETERTSRTLRMMLTASSTGPLISVSTSSGAAPGSSVRIVMVGIGEVGQQVQLEPRQRHEAEQGDGDREHHDGDAAFDREVDQ